ncbi:hypothetical protein [Lentibacillus sp. CBA3610]|uniref:hypothetical protein n=1 Tax=Lentibacillus sp. CBA3610 TaxID=2518176 RepID=UPI00159552A7|nr:hypothetical protein [Lentibacillus sp. CBA3610]QKY70734.1 hypothetical protein Len3610_15060 [Lentibacillus sp. CBA3610]
MEIKIGDRTITSKSIFNIMFILVLIATIAQMILNVLSHRNLITGMVIFSACAAGICYYFSKENSN